MEFVRVVKNSDDLANIIDIPKGLRNRKVEVIILPYLDRTEIDKTKQKSLRGVLSKYKNETLRDKESEAWPSAMVDKHEHN